MLLGIGLLLTGCGAKPEPKPMSTRAKQEALAKSGLPGAASIGSALRVTDSADARRRLEDSISRAVP